MQSANIIKMKTKPHPQARKFVSSRKIKKIKSYQIKSPRIKSYPLSYRIIPITIYTTPTCPYCVMAKHWLTQKKISFKEINVIDDDKARDYIIAKSRSTGVPQIEIGRKVIVGFDREALEQALLKKKR